jgi:O-antigen/teichoic acid export membrane protein
MRIPLLSTQDKHWREVLEKSSIAFVMKALGAGLAFAFNIVLARMLGADGAGIFFLALTIATIAAVFGRIGLDNTLVRLIAANATSGDWAAVKGIYRRGMQLALAASCMAALAVFLGAPWLAEHAFAKPTLVTPMRWMALAVVPIALLVLHAEALKGLKRVFDSSLVYEHGIGISVFSLLGLYFLGPTWGVNGAIWAFTLAAALTFLTGLCLWWKAMAKLRGVCAAFSVRELLQSSLPLFWVATMNLAMNWAPSLLLGVWCTNADVGVFNVALRTAQLTSFVLFAVNTIAAPKFAELYREGNLKQLGSMARNSAKLMVLAASPALLLFICFPGWIMGLFGQQFANRAVVLTILSIGQFVNVATGSVGYLLMMTGNERLVRNNVVFIALLSIVLNLILIPFAGVMGAAIATAFSLAAKNLIAVYLVRLRLSIQTIPIEWIGLGWLRRG